MSLYGCPDPNLLLCPHRVHVVDRYTTSRSIDYHTRKKNKMSHPEPSSAKKTLY